jgi:inner membrane transporter RhtA
VSHAVGKRTIGSALVIASCASVQGSAALAETIFDVVAPSGVVAWRQFAGAVVMLIIAAAMARFRFAAPLFRRRSAREWVWIVVLGAAMATMNLSYYYAVQSLPLGVAATLMFLGPFALAAVGSTRAWHLVPVTAALIGVVLVSRPSGEVTTQGVAIGLVAGAALACYTLASRQLGRRSGIDGLALATACSALLLSPLAIKHAAEPGAGEWGVLFVLGAVGITATFVSDFFALKFVGSRVVAALFALDPVIGAILGIVVLADPLTWPLGLGICIIAAAGALTAATSPIRAATEDRTQRSRGPARANSP